MSDDPKASELPEPEVLKAHGENSTSEATDNRPTSVPDEPKRGLFHRGSKAPKRTTYRPSHKATYIGLAVVAAILLINAAIVAFVFNSQDDESTVNRSEVTLSTDNLDQLGVSRNPVGSAGSALTIGPDATFNGTVEVAGDATIGGSLTINDTFNAAEGSFSNLQGGETSLESVNINGDGTVTNLNVRTDLVVDGVTRLQGPVTVSQLMTVNNNMNVTGNLAVGGALSVRSLVVNALSTDTTLTIGGKIITRGSAPSVGAGGAVGSNGTVSISGTDTAGTVAVNIGVGANPGALASISFRGAYATMPKVLVTSIGRSAGNIYVNRSATGFTIYTTSALSPGGYAFDYFVIQ